MLNFNQIRVFYHVAKNLSFTMAAKELFITQPAVTAQIKAFEDCSNLKLYKRRGRNIYLTDRIIVTGPLVKVAVIFKVIKVGKFVFRIWEIVVIDILVGLADRIGPSLMAKLQVVLLWNYFRGELNGYRLKGLYFHRYEKEQCSRVLVLEPVLDLVKLFRLLFFRNQ